jgi:hypothetical protein
MAKPNYSFEKRQRELEKKRKKAEKLANKAARANGPAQPQEVGEGEPAQQVDPSQPVPEVPKE